MPKKVNMSKRVAVENKNKKVLTDAMDGKEAIFGKVEKALGNCAFKVNIQDPKSKQPKLKAVQGLIRGSFKGGSKSETFLAAGMFVILAAAEERADSHEIIGVINKKKDLKALIDDNLLPVILMDTQDDLFDYTGVEEEDGAIPDRSTLHAVVRHSVGQAQPPGGLLVGEDDSLALTREATASSERRPGLGRRYSDRVAAWEKDRAPSPSSLGPGKE